MPFKSQAQRKFMYAKHPEIAEEFEEKTPDKELPEHVAKRSALKKMEKRHGQNNYRSSE